MNIKNITDITLGETAKGSLTSAVYMRGIAGNGKAFCILQSYKTIVAVVYDDTLYYDYFSPTTSKHLKEWREWYAPRYDNEVKDDKVLRDIVARLSFPVGGRL